MRKPKILIVEDDKELVHAYQLLLQNDYMIETCDRIEEAYSFLSNPNNNCLVVLADLQLLDGNLKDHLAKAEWKEIHSHVKFLFVSVQDEVKTIEDCLWQWGDDYLVKPFHNSELLVKLKKLSHLVYSPRLDPVQHKLKYNGLLSEELTSTEFKVIAHLLSTPDMVSEREILQKVVWQNSSSSTKISMTLSRLRPKLNSLDIEVVQSQNKYVELRIA